MGNVNHHLSGLGKLDRERLSAIMRGTKGTITNEQAARITGLGRYAEGRVYYVGPLMQKRNLARIKFDLTTKERLVLPPQKRSVHHPYSDCPDDGIHVLSYCFEEVFAEKERALAEQERPRDLYDVVHLYRHDEIRPDRGVVLKTLQEKCAFKGIPVPTTESLQREDAKIKLAAEWEDTYVFKCPSCGKQFRRKTYDATLSPHKNKNGFQCFGGFGSLVKTEY